MVGENCNIGKIPEPMASMANNRDGESPRRAVASPAVGRLNERMRGQD